MEGLGGGWGESVVAAVAGEAGVPGEALSVVAEVELVVGLGEAAGGQNELGLVIAVEAGAGKDVEGPVGTVAKGGVESSALDFEVVDVFGIDLRADVRGDVGVGDLNAVDEPGELMAAAHVEHVVGHVGAGDEGSNHGHAVGAVGAGREGNFFAADEGDGGGGVGVGGLGVDGDGVGAGNNGELEVEDGRGSGGEGEGLGLGGEARFEDLDAVVADGDGGEGEGAVGACGDALGVGGVGSVEFDVCAGDGAVLGVVDNALDAAEDLGVGGQAECEREQECGERAHRCFLPVAGWRWCDVGDGLPQGLKPLFLLKNERPKAEALGYLVAGGFWGSWLAG